MYNILVVSDDEQLSKELIHFSGQKLNIKKIITSRAASGEELSGYDFVLAPPSLVAFFRGGEAQTSHDIETYYTEKLTEQFLSRSGGMEELLKTVKNEIFSNVPDAEKAENLLRKIYSNAIDNAFSKNEWLELYYSHEDFEGRGCAYLRERLIVLYREYTAIFPQVNSDKTEEVILYILNNPESDLRQKTIASKMYVNSSYLSTVFAAQTGERFVDYLTSVKLKRAAYLLMKSTMRISEIAARLDYKDIGYFSRLFRNCYGIPPSQYRIPDNYTYEI